MITSAINRFFKVPPEKLLVSALKYKQFGFAEDAIKLGINLSDPNLQYKLKKLFVEQKQGGSSFEFLLRHKVTTIFDSQIHLLQMNLQRKELIFPKTLAFGAKFGLAATKNTFQIDNTTTPFNHGGWNGQITLMLLEFFNTLKEDSQIKEEPEICWIINNLESIYSAYCYFIYGCFLEDAVHNFKNGNPILIPSGWSDHSATYVFYQDKLTIINSGERPINKNILQMLEVNPEKLTTQLLSDITNYASKLDKIEGSYFVHTEIPEKLGCKDLNVDISGIPKSQYPKEQKSEDCYIKSQTIAFLPLIMALLDKRGYSQTDQIELAKHIQHFLIDLWSLHLEKDIMPEKSVSFDRDAQEILDKKKKRLDRLEYTTIPQLQKHLPNFNYTLDK